MHGDVDRSDEEMQCNTLRVTTEAARGLEREEASATAEGKEARRSAACLTTSPGGLPNHVTRRLT